METDNTVDILEDVAVDMVEDVVADSLEAGKPVVDNRVAVAEEVDSLRSADNEERIEVSVAG